jgi:hypothetical protein
MELWHLKTWCSNRILDAPANRVIVEFGVVPAAGMFVASSSEI